MARISSWTSFAAAITTGSSGVSLAALVLMVRRDSVETAGAADLALPWATMLLRVAMACASAVRGSGISRNSPQLKSAQTYALCVRNSGIYVKLSV